METLNVIITEIVVCLIITWILGFLTSWFSFRKRTKAYMEEIEELIENLQYSNLCNKNQERELIKQNYKIEELEKDLELNYSKENEIVKVKKNTHEDIEILDSIDNNLNSIK